MHPRSVRISVQEERQMPELRLWEEDVSAVLGFGQEECHPEQGFAVHVLRQGLSETGCGDDTANDDPANDNFEDDDQEHH
jgi:hypothetical protein